MTTDASYKLALEKSPDGIVMVNRNGEHSYANSAFARAIGYKKREILQQRYFDYASEFTGGVWAAFFDQVWRGGIDEHETSFVRKDGKTIQVIISFSPIEAGEEKQLCAFVRDITELKNRIKQREQFGFLINNATDAIYIFDEYRNIRYVNDEASTKTGYSKQELLRMNVSELDPNHPVTTPEMFRERVTTGDRVVFETRHRRKDGESFPVEISHAVSEYEGDVFICAFVRDITDRKLAMQQAEELRFAFENSSDAIYLYDRQGKIYYANRKACDTLGYSREEITNKTIRSIDPHFHPAGHEEMWVNRKGDEIAPLETVHFKSDGSAYPVEVVASSSVYEGKHYAVAFVRDISERLQVKKALEESEERFRVIADTSPVALIISRLSDGRIQYGNKQAQMLFQRSSVQLNQTTLVDLLRDCGGDDEIIDSIMDSEEIHGREMLLINEEEVPLWISLNTKSIELQGEKVVCCALLDVSEARELSNQLNYQAAYDDLTGLVNRREFEDRLQEVIEIARERKTSNALCYFDLDQFKIINDTCGHMAGDELLRQLAEELQKGIRKDDTLARLGGDEFAILLENCTLEHAERVANHVRKIIQDFRFTWQDDNFSVGASFGLVPIGQEEDSITDVLRRADTACYAAKDGGRNRIHVYRFDDEELAQRHGEMRWVTRINSALDEDRFELWMQKICPATHVNGENDHFEMLLRMRDSDGTVIPPSEFLPAAERYDLAPRIDRWVVSQTFRWFAERPEKLSCLRTCALNLSGQSLGDEQFLEDVIHYLKDSNIPPGKVCFEITETAAISNLSHALHFMKSLKALGCTFALDDFGSGLSSFAYLKNLSVDYVKIDGVFVKDIMTDPVDLAMVRSINDMAHALGKKTVAEFVENDAILGKLIELGVDFVQGYGIEKPAPLQ